SSGILVCSSNSSPSTLVDLPDSGRVPTLVGPRLAGMVALVSGASRGLGKGIALGLGEAGGAVLGTRRATRRGARSLPGTIDETAAEVTRRGGQGIPVRCDHRIDREVEALFVRLRGEQGRLDILVNNAIATAEPRVLWSGQRFWQIPVTLWDDLMDVGLRSHFMAARYSAPLLIEQGSGLVVNVASHASTTAKSPTSRTILPYSFGKPPIHPLSRERAA